MEGIQGACIEARTSDTTATVATSDSNDDDAFQPTRERVLLFIAQYQREQHCPTTRREIRDALGIGMGTVTYSLDVLEQEGLITRRAGMARNIFLTQRAEIILKAIQG